MSGVVQAAHRRLVGSSFIGALRRPAQDSGTAPGEPVVHDLGRHDPGGPGNVLVIGDGPAGDPAGRSGGPAGGQDPDRAQDPDRPQDPDPGHDSGDGSVDPGGRRGRRRVIAGRGLSALAGLLVFLALIAPNVVSRLTVPGGYLRLPIEALLGIGALLVLPARARRPVAALAGAVLGLLTIEKAIDMGFYQVLARPFDPVLDWVLFDDAYSFLTDSAGRAGALGAAAGVVVAAVAILVLMALAVLRVSGVVVRHRRAAARGAGALTVAWVACAVLGAQLVPGIPLAARSTVTYAYDRGYLVRAGLLDQQKFAAESAVDAFADTPGDRLLTGLRGKDVLFAFVESYGRSAIEDPELAPQVDALLDTGTRRLAAAGYDARSAFLTAPTAGGGSWLAHSTFLSGLWINNEQRYRNLTSSDRLTLTGAFKRADWRTVSVMPGATRAWPEGDFYGYDKVYDSRNLGYRGPQFSWAPMPDQYTLSAFERTERATPDRGPLMAEMPLVSSHTPWAPIPRFIDWDDVGDGSVYHAIAAKGKRPGTVWKDPKKVRVEYRRSVEYSLTSLISYVETFGDDDLVLVVLGDHQPAPIITGDGASRDVPITIVSRDAAVLNRIADWGWQDGLNPDPQAPVWRMDSFRDRFLTAYGPRTGS